MFDALAGKRVLVVDDEPDVCRFVGFELPDCHVDYAVTFEEARERFASAEYDLAILDVMGVRGFELLDEFADRVPCIVLTARALSAEDLERARKGRAVLFLPKHELGRLDECAARALESRESLWPWLFRRVDFRRWFGPDFEPPTQDEMAAAPEAG